MNYQKIYNSLVTKYQGPSKEEARDFFGYVESHHILPRCLQGSDDPSNIVHLPARAHFLAHYLLVKIHPDNPDLWWAFHMMSQANTRGFKVTSRMYQTIRQNMFRLGRSDEIKQKISETLSGRILGPHSEEHRAKIAAAHKGKKKNFSAEGRARIAESIRGTKRTQEQKDRMSIAIKAAFQAKPRRKLTDAERLARCVTRGPQSELTSIRKKIAWAKRKGIEPSPAQLEILRRLTEQSDK